MTLKFLNKYALLGCSLSLIALASCNENDSLGSSLGATENEVVIESDFSLVGHSVEIDSIQSRTTMQLLGVIDAQGYGKFSSDFVTQYMPAAEIDSLIKTKENIDSLKMVLLVKNGDFVGDSIIPMGLEVFRLNKTLKAPIYSSFNPEDYYNPADCIGSTVYTLNGVELTDSLQQLNYREIYVNLPISLADELFDLYKSDPKAYLDPQQFNEFFKGFYVKNSFGTGRVAKVGANTLLMYYHYQTKNSAGNDTIIRKTGNFYAVTPEIITNNNINYSISQSLLDDAQNGQNLIVAPAGLEVEVVFPIREIISQYHEKSGKLSVVNNLTLEIPASKITNNYGINPPENVMLILKNKKKEFFEKSKVPDNETSFTATYNPSKGVYSFSSMRQYFLNMLAENEINEEDYVFIITPVTINTLTNTGYYQNSTIVSSVVPYVEQPAMATLELEKAKISLTFTKQNLKN